MQAIFQRVDTELRRPNPFQRFPLIISLIINSHPKQNTEKAPITGLELEERGGVTSRYL
jgi:hypothetical protein